MPRSSKSLTILRRQSLLLETPNFKKLGGRYNPRLKCGQGWVFSAKKRDEVEDLVKWINILQKQLSLASTDFKLDKQ